MPLIRAPCLGVLLKAGAEPRTLDLTASAVPPPGQMPRLLLRKAWGVRLSVQLGEGARPVGAGQKWRVLGAPDGRVPLVGTGVGTLPAMRSLLLGVMGALCSWRHSTRVQLVSR